MPAGYMPSGALAGPNYTLTAADFPLFQLLNELDRNSPVVTGTNDRVGPAGSFSEVYDRSFPLLLPDDVCSITKASAAIFHAGPYPARQVEPRHAPTVVNAALNNRQFWDGRANNMFNGVAPFGMRDINGDPTKRLIFLDGSGNPYLGYLHASPMRASPPRRWRLPWLPRRCRAAAGPSRMSAGRCFSGSLSRSRR